MEKKANTILERLAKHMDFDEETGDVIYFPKRGVEMLYNDERVIEINTHHNKPHYIVTARDEGENEGEYKATSKALNKIQVYKKAKR